MKKYKLYKVEGYVYGLNDLSDKPAGYLLDYCIDNDDVIVHLKEVDCTEFDTIDEDGFDITEEALDELDVKIRDYMES